MEATIKTLTNEDQKLLSEILIRQHYAIEIVLSEINDIESGVKTSDQRTYQHLLSLYERLRRITLK